MQIKSYWQSEYVKWDGEKFVDKKLSEIEEKELKITLDTTNIDKPIVKFHGGPTGFESYYLSDLLNNPFYASTHKEDNNFCICGGTINSWPRCWVKTKDLKFILEVLTNALRS